MLPYRIALFAFLWASIRTAAIGQAADSWDAVRNLVRQAAPKATVKYCGSLAYRNIDYYLFILEQNELAGLVLIRQQPGSGPIIIDADTSFFPFKKDQEPALDEPVMDGVEILLRRRNLAKGIGTPRETSTRFPEVSLVGDAIDRVVFPISGFRIESDATSQILQRLRTVPATEVEPRTAPPGSIIVSPTRFSRSGPVYLGHAGIVGKSGSIYSADARFGGALARNMSVAGWLKRFSGNNGCYAFVLQASLEAGAQRFYTAFSVNPDRFMYGYGALLFRIAAMIITFFISGCDDEPDDGSGVPSNPSRPSQRDLAQAAQIADAASANSITPRSNDATTAQGNGDLGVLGGDANQNQQVFREKYGLTDPTQDQLSQWNEYDSRLTAYSDKDPDWQYPTAASANWMGTTWTNGDPLAVEGTTVSVDFSRIPRGSLIYIPALNMYAEANDTGATGTWASSDAGQMDYDSNGAGRVDVYNLSGDRTSRQVEQDFQNQVGSNEYGQIYIVHRGPGWKTGGN